MSDLVNNDVEMANDEGADPSGDTQNQNPDQASTAADTVDENDPHKVEKLTKAGHDKDPDEGSD